MGTAPTISRKPKTNPDCPLKTDESHQTIRAGRAGCKCPGAPEAVAADLERGRQRDAIRRANGDHRGIDSRNRTASDRVPAWHVPAPAAAPSKAPAVRQASPPEQHVHQRSDHACRDEDPELFFPVPTRGPAHQAQVAAAKDVCRRCPVLAACLQGVLARGEEFGVWAATTPDERKAIRRGRVADSAAA